MIKTKNDFVSNLLLCSALALFIAGGVAGFHGIERSGNKHRLKQINVGKIVRVNSEPEGNYGLMVSSPGSTELKKYTLIGEVRILQDLPTDKDIYVEEAPCSYSGIGCFFMDSGHYNIHIHGPDDL